MNEWHSVGPDIQQLLIKKNVWWNNNTAFVHFRFDYSKLNLDASCNWLCETVGVHWNNTNEQQKPFFLRSCFSSWKLISDTAVKTDRDRRELEAVPANWWRTFPFRGQKTLKKKKISDLYVSCLSETIFNLVRKKNMSAVTDYPDKQVTVLQVSDLFCVL